ncbi:MAG: ABC transporter ATP-binding protein [Chloroflexi bacterium]|nr:ABC transporter ATP-binding protein [Chloroflexota bacterium]
MNLAQSPPSAPEPIISARGLSRVFGTGETSVTAVNQVTLDIHPGSFMAVVGRSGSGKTTLLNLLSGLDRPTGGEVFFQGRDLTTLPEADLVELRRNKIGFVFQSFGLMPLLSALENVELPLHIRGVSWRERRRRALEALETVGLGPRSRHRPYELSGGEQQRVSIARALVTGADAIFADEPTGELDTTTAVSIGEILRDVARERGATVIVATHDLVLAEITDRIVELVDGQIISEK